MSDDTPRRKPLEPLILPDIISIAQGRRKAMLAIMEGWDGEDADDAATRLRFIQQLT